MSGKASKPPTDWEAIEREYRAGQLSVSEIGRLHGVSHTAINKRAKREGWTRDLAARVRQVVSARLVSEGVSAEGQIETVERAAERDIQIIRGHRGDIRAARELGRQLLDELKAATENKDEIEEAIEEETAGDMTKGRRNAMLRAVSLSSRSGVLSNIASAMKTIVALERQAFGLDDAELPDEPATRADVATMVQKLDARQREQLRSITRSIVERSGPDPVGA